MTGLKQRAAFLQREDERDEKAWAQWFLGAFCCVVWFIFGIYFVEGIGPVTLSINLWYKLDDICHYMLFQNREKLNCRNLLLCYFPSQRMWEFRSEGWNHKGLKHLTRLILVWHPCWILFKAWRGLLNNLVLCGRSIESLPKLNISFSFYSHSFYLGNDDARLFPARKLLSWS